MHRGHKPSYTVSWNVPPTYSPHLSATTREFLSGLLTVSVDRRLGCGASGVSALKTHALFCDVDWTKLQTRTLTPPIEPDCRRANCSANFDLEDPILAPLPEAIAPQLDRMFAGFNYRTHTLTLTHEREGEGEDGGGGGGEGRGGEGGGGDEEEP